MVRTDIFEWEIMKDASGKDRGIRVISIDKKEEYVKVPETMEGLPVLELGPYALEGSAIREIELPACLERIGRYAFYNCEKLEHIELPEGMKDIGSGAFTGAHKIKKICLYVPDENMKLIVLMEIISEVVEAVEVILRFSKPLEEIRAESSHTDGREIRLIFPEYYELGVENTPGRNIISEYFGTGLKYRNCFVSRQLQYEEYDKLFELSGSVEKTDVMMELALRRLIYPYKLKDKYKECYLRWISDHAEDILTLLIEEKRLEDIRFVLQHADISNEIRNIAALQCSEQGFAAAVTLFMEHDSKAGESCDSDQASSCGEKAEDDAADGPLIHSMFDLDDI